MVSCQFEVSASLMCTYSMEAGSAVSEDLPTIRLRPRSPGFYRRCTFLKLSLERQRACFPAINFSVYFTVALYPFSIKYLS